MKHLIRKLPWVLGVGVVALVLMYALWPRPIRVEIAPVTRGPMMVTVDEDGKTRVKERYIVSAPIAGLIGRLELHPVTSSRRTGR